MDKRYQVFISSTFSDLQVERQEILQALLELDCIPSGMELFPAANEDQLSLIRKVISDCDYYIVIIAGKYGSIGPEGLSYTEMEYRYAIEAGKPLIAFIHRNIQSLPGNKLEENDEARKKLATFMELAKKKMVKFWDSPQELGSVVSRSLIQLIKNNPMPGWVRADNLPSESAAQEILKLRNTIDSLRASAAERSQGNTHRIERLAQGDELFKVECLVIYNITGGYQWETKRVRYIVKTIWNSAFSAILPSLIDEASEHTMKSKIDSFAQKEFSLTIAESEYFKGKTIQSVEFSPESFDTLKVQMAALGIIEKSSKPRSLKNSGTYWSLTPLGEKLMYELRAIRRDLITDQPDSPLVADASQKQ